MAIDALSRWQWRCLALTLLLAAYGCETLDVERAKREAAAGRSDIALQILRPLADQGNVEAWYEMGQLHAGRMQGRENWQEALPWYLKAAEAGNTKAQLKLGDYYASTQKDYGQAFNWYRRAAEKPNEEAGALAARNVGGMYKEGLGVERDSTEAARWLRKAAESKLPSAQLELAALYFTGDGVPRDIDESVRLLTSAANSKSRSAQTARYVLAFIYAEGLGRQADALEAASWMSGKRVSDPGEAAFLIGRFYQQGFFVATYDIPVLRWLLEQARMPSDEREKYLKAIERQQWSEWDTAIQWYRKAAAAGFVGAQVSLDSIPANENSVSWDCGEAWRWGRVASERTDATAYVNMGLLYQRGPERTVVGIGAALEHMGDAIKVVSVLPGTPAERYGLAANDLILTVNGHRTGSLRLSELVEQIRRSSNKPMVFDLRRAGLADTRSVSVIPAPVTIQCPGAKPAGLKKDPGEAVKWFSKAADAGDMTGLFLLAKAYRDGNGVAQDKKQAVRLYDQGAARGDWEAAQEIAHMYLVGEGVEKSSEKYEEWMRKATDLKKGPVRRL